VKWNSEEQYQAHPEAMPLVEPQHQPINTLKRKNSWRIVGFMLII